tara:strand:+ start:895 stop:1782 length:888 start_codon:yes stop_codon:yes gene_type:complete
MSSKSKTTITKKSICSKVCDEGQCEKKCEPVKQKVKAKRVCVKAYSKAGSKSRLLCSDDPNFDISKVRKGGTAGYFGKRPPRLNQNQEPAKMKARKERPIKFKEIIKTNANKISKIKNALTKIDGRGIKSSYKIAYSNIAKKYPITNFSTHGKRISVDETKKRNKIVRTFIQTQLKDLEIAEKKYKPKQVSKLREKYQELRNEISKYGSIQKIKNRSPITISFDTIGYDSEFVNKQKQKLDKKIKLMEAIMKNSLKKSIEINKIKTKGNEQQKLKRRETQTKQQRERRRKRKQNN